jgi:indolepyruvate ferredoxin oxidoreductase
VRGVVGQLCSHLTRDTVDNMARIAAIPLDIRGFGPVKLAAVIEVRERVGSALDCL